MPELFRQYGFVFLFFSKEHEQEIMRCIEKLGNEYLSIAS